MSEIPREQFVREYAERSGLLGKVAVTDFGLLGENWARVAMPCDCGDEICEGWMMVNPAEFLTLLTPPNRADAIRSPAPE